MAKIDVAKATADSTYFLQPNFLFCSRVKMLKGLGLLEINSDIIHKHQHAGKSL